MNEFRFVYHGDLGSSDPKVRGGLSRLLGAVTQSVQFLLPGRARLNTGPGVTAGPSLPTPPKIPEPNELSAKTKSQQFNWNWEEKIWCTGCFNMLGVNEVQGVGQISIFWRILVKICINLGFEKFKKPSNLGENWPSVLVKSLWGHPVGLVGQQMQIAKQG